MNLNTGYRLCQQLKVKEKCFRVQVYKEGEIQEVFHEHIPAHRMSQESAIQAIRALAKDFDGIGPEALLGSFLNKRGKVPAATEGYSIVPESPEPGVVRFYCTGRAATAWVEEVGQPLKFRVEEKAITSL